MLNQSQLKSPKAYYNESSITSSPTADSFFKKKPFMRKPAVQGALFNLESCNKHTNDNQEPHETMFNFSSPLGKQEKKESRSKMNSIVDTSNRERIISMRNPGKESIFYSPKAQNVSFWKDLSYISDNSQKKQEKKVDQIKRKNTNTEILNLTKKNSQVENKKNAGSQRNYKPGYMKNRTSSTNFLLEKDTIEEIKNKENEKELSLMYSYGSKSSKQITTVECLYCKNNKKLANILTQKYNKMQNQYTKKLRQNLQLEVLYNNLKIEKTQMKKQKDRILKEFDTSKIIFQKVKEDLLTKIEIQREEIMKLNDKTRYQQIQKSILLRVKQDHQALTKTNLQLKNQHQIMKKTIIASNQSKLVKANFQKIKKISTPENYKSSKLNEKSFIFHSPSNRISEDLQDDNISLNFSEFSVQNFMD